MSNEVLPVQEVATLLRVAAKTAYAMAQGLWEIMAPDIDPAKSFADQDPMATLKSPQYAQFKSRFLKLASVAVSPLRYGLLHPAQTAATRWGIVKCSDVALSRSPRASSLLSCAETAPRFGDV